jgi:hypothetical protein
MSNNCIDLMPYASSISDLAILTGGGVMSNNVPVFFDIPSQVVAGEVKYCLENVTIPTHVGGNDCTEAQNCWMSVGLHASNDYSDPSATEVCQNASGDSVGCYDCACRGMSMSTGVEPNTLAAYCGLHTDTDWGVTCGDTTNGSFSWGEEEQMTSLFSTVHVSICSESNSDCGLCRGGIHPSFRIGVQWISDLQEQCFDHPFGEGCSEGFHLASIMGISVGSVLMVGAMLSLGLFMRQRKKEAMRGSSRSGKGSVQSEATSVPLEILSWRTDDSL